MAEALTGSSWWVGNVGFAVRVIGIGSLDLGADCFIGDVGGTPTAASGSGPN